MAKYTVTRACGHVETVALFGKVSQREWRLENVESQKLCEECYKAKLAEERERENREAAEAAQEMGLPQLIGTEKQVAWAETIRQNMLANIERFIYTKTKKSYGVIDGGNALVALDRIKSKVEAKWWIDHRNETEDRYSIADLLKKELEEEMKEVSQPPVEVVADAMAEATVRPESPVTETVAEIRVLDDKIEIELPERREDFRQLVKSLKYEWSGKCWRRTLLSRNGTPEDRAAEAGHRLLAAGFPIRIYDAEVRAKAISGEYENEHTRWVMVRTGGEYKGWLTISWEWPDDFYKAARRLPGSRYSKPSVVVPPEQFEEVLDFAKMYDFRFSPKAQEVIEQARSIKENSIIVKVDPLPEAEHIVTTGKPPVLEVPAEVEIDEEFRD